MLWALLACQVMEKPSVVIIVVDTLRADHVGVYGAKNPTTPNLDAYAKQGIYFDRAYAHSGWTLPSMTSFWTGLYPHEHRVVRSPTSSEEFGSLPLERVTLAEVFQKGKYKTAAVVNNTFLAPDFNLQQGFDQYFYQGADNSEIRSAKDSTDVALQWWRGNKGAKMMVVHYMEPHMDLDPPELTRGRFLPKDKTIIPVPFKSRDAFAVTHTEGRDPNVVNQVLELYDEEILAVDVQIARLTAALGTENIMYVFTSDHGEEFWEHNGFEHGHHLKSDLTRIPLVFWGEGIERQGKNSAVVSHVDTFHSILSYAGLPIPAGTHGSDILKGKIPEDQYVVSENTLYGDPMLSIVNKEYRLEINQLNKMAVLWNLDGHGMEKDNVVENRQALSNPLFQKIQQIRGDLEVVKQVVGPQIPSKDVFQELKLLGYIDE